MDKILENDVKKVIDALAGDMSGKAINSEVGNIEKEEVGEIETNANEVMHTGNTGYGKELIPVDVLTNQIVELVPSYSTFLATLPGFHGTGLAVSQKVPVIGEVDFFQGNTEPTTGAQAVGQATHRLATGEVTITQAPLIANVFISKRELTYSIVDLEMLIKTRLSKSLARTMESMLINCDSETGGTGNVNSDDQAPATTFATTGGASDHRLLLDHGLREIAINGSLTVNGGTLDRADFISAMNLLGDMASSPADLLWLFNRATYNKALGLDDFAKANDAGKASTLSGQALTNILGADLFVARDLAKSEADGKQSATPGNNTLGQFLIFHKSAVQHGYGQPFEIDVQKVPGKGLSIVATVEWGFAIAQLKAGNADSSVSLVRNITL